MARNYNAPRRSTLVQKNRKQATAGRPSTVPEVIRLAGGYELRPIHFKVTGWDQFGEPRELTLCMPEPGKEGQVFFANREWLASLKAPPKADE